MKEIEISLWITVKIKDDAHQSTQLLEGPGYVEQMQSSLGKTGKVIRIDGNNIKVHVAQEVSWDWTSDCLEFVSTSVKIERPTMTHHLDKFTYGKSKAAIKLVDMINSHPNSKVMSRKVGRIFDSINYKMNQIELIKDRSIVENMHTLILKDIEENHLNFLYRDGFRPGPQRCRTANSELESKITSHIINVLKGRFKSWRRGERNDIIRIEKFNETTDIHKYVSGKQIINIRSPEES